jgi:signal transduction histidine kinase
MGEAFVATAVTQNHSRSGGLGLFSIRERLTENGGTLELLSADAGGSTIHLRVPVPSCHAILSAEGPA